MPGPAAAKCRHMGAGLQDAVDRPPVVHAGDSVIPALPHEREAIGRVSDARIEARRLHLRQPLQHVARQDGDAHRSTVSATLDAGCARPRPLYFGSLGSLLGRCKCCGTSIVRSLTSDGAAPGTSGQPPRNDTPPVA